MKGKYDISSRETQKETIEQIKKEIDKSTFAHGRKKVLLEIISNFEQDNQALINLATNGYNALDQSEKDRIDDYRNFTENGVIFTAIESAKNLNTIIRTLENEKNSEKEAKAKAQQELATLQQDLQNQRQSTTTVRNVVDVQNQNLLRVTEEKNKAEREKNAALLAKRQAETDKAAEEAAKRKAEEERDKLRQERDDEQAAKNAEVLARQKAEQERNKARLEKAIVDAAKQKMEEERNRALQEKDKEQTAKTAAEAARIKAEQERNKARVQKAIVDEARQKMEKQRDLALQEKAAEEALKNAALIAKTAAENAQLQTEQQKLALQNQLTNLQTTSTNTNAALQNQLHKITAAKTLSDQEINRLRNELANKPTSERIVTVFKEVFRDNKSKTQKASKPSNNAQSDDFNVKLIEAANVAFGGSKFVESVNKVILANRFINAAKSGIKNKTFTAEESLKEQFYFDQNKTKLRDSEFNNYISSTQSVSDVEIEYYKTHRQKVLADRGIKNLTNASDQEIIAEIVKDKVAAIIKMLPKVVEKLNVDNPQQAVSKFNAAEMTVLLSVGNYESLEQWRNENKDRKINQSFLGELNKSSKENDIRSKAVDNFVTIIKKYGDLFAQGEVSRKILAERNDKEQLSDDQITITKEEKQLIDMIDKIAINQTASELEIKYYKENGRNNLGNKVADQEIIDKIIEDKIEAIIKVLPEVAKKLNVKNPQQAINQLSTAEMTALLSVSNSEALKQWRDNNQDGKIYNSFVGPLSENSPENTIRLQAMQNFVKEYKDLLAPDDNIITKSFGASKPKNSPASLDVKHISSNDRSRGG